MRFLLLLPLLIASSLLAVPVHSGLGEAASKSKSATYDAWCGEKGNDCKVSFANEKITVNDKDSVDFDDITYIIKDWSGNYVWDGLTFGIEYRNDDGSLEFAEIWIAHYPTARKFWRDLKRACRNCKDRDGVQVDVNIKE